MCKRNPSPRDGLDAKRASKLHAGFCSTRTR
jgi:hypothetical protein